MSGFPNHAARRTSSVQRMPFRMQSILPKSKRKLAYVVYMKMNICAHTHISVCVSIKKHVYVIIHLLSWRMYMYMYIHKYIHTYIHTYSCIGGSRSLFGFRTAVCGLDSRVFLMLKGTACRWFARCRAQ